MADKFPGPYLNRVEKDESTMQYVPTDKLGIGARNSGLPKDIRSQGMGVEHVGGTAGSK
jgi:hypothetical protein